MFRATVDSHAQEFAVKMNKKFEMSMIGELAYFFELKVKHNNDRMFVSHSKTTKNLVKRIGLDGKIYMCTPMSTNVKLGVDPS